ncbi:MAG: ABC transporter ATP-binding protein [Candidatus Natronoplasma sp.]
MERGQEAVISLEDVLVRYGDVIGLDFFSAKIPKGISGVLGPNGAGKTTLIKVLLGHVKPEEGWIRFDDIGESQDNIRRKENIGYMPESECLVQDMTGFELVSYMGQLSGLFKDDSVERAHESLDFVEIGEERYREINSYSTGMKQRVKLAQAFVHDPDILFLDEPTNGMDPDGKEDMLDLVDRIGSSDKTILISSHILLEIEQVSDYIIIMNEGKNLKSGFMEEMMDSEKSRYKLKVRGREDNIQLFKRSLEDQYDIIDIVNKNREAVIRLDRMEDSSKLFKMVEKNAVQLRYLRPDLRTLEDFFLRSFEKGDNDGD